MPLKLLPPKGPRKSWSVRGRYLGTYIDRRSTGASDRATASRVLKKWQREIECGEFAEPNEPTFASAAVAYMRAGGERTYIKRLVEHFGDATLRSLDQAAIDDAAFALYPSASPATRNRQVYTPVCAVLRHGGIRLDLRRPSGAGGNKQTAWLWPEQAEALFNEAAKIDERFATLLIVLCYTGMRLSEALKLNWNDVRLQDGFAYVPDTKNNEPRAVFLPVVAVAAMGNMADREGRVFRFSKGGHIYNLLKAAAFKSGVDLPARSAFHIFRHTYATWMRRYAGADSQTLIATGAWKDRKSVERYSHTVVREEAKLAERLPTPGRKTG